MRGDSGRRQTADDFLPNEVTLRPGTVLPAFGRGRISRRPEPLAVPQIRQPVFD
jgi:hypothetical protein